MRILIAEDEPVSCQLLQSTLVEWGYQVIVTQDGHQAWQLLQQEQAPRLAVLDWMMPGMDGLEVCRKVRATRKSEPPYLILLTVNGNHADTVKGLQAGANDYVGKPFDNEELRARLQVGASTVQLQSELAERVRQLEDALAQVKCLQGLLPICCYCNRIRDDKHYWHQVERYIAAHSDARFSHGVCPDCFEKVMSSELEELRKKAGEG